MKRIITSVLALVMIATMLFTFVACSSYNAIKSDFEDAGYTLQNPDKEETKEIKTDDGVITYTVHTFQKEGTGILGNLGEAFSTAIVWEFGSDKDLAKALENDPEMKNLLAKAQESKLVNGNCFLMTINPEAIEIFGQSK